MGRKFQPPGCISGSQILKYNRLQSRDCSARHHRQDSVQQVGVAELQAALPGGYRSTIVCSKVFRQHGEWSARKKA